MKIIFFSFLLVAVANAQTIVVSAQNSVESISAATAGIAAQSGKSVTAVEVDENGNEVPDGIVVKAEPAPAPNWFKPGIQLGVESGTTAPYAFSVGASIFRGMLSISGQWMWGHEAGSDAGHGYTITLDPIAGIKPGLWLRPTLSYKYFRLNNDQISGGGVPIAGDTSYTTNRVQTLYGLVTKPIGKNTQYEFSVQAGKGDRTKAVWTEDKALTLTQGTGNVLVVGVKVLLK